MNIFRTKTVEQTIKEADEGEHKLKRELSALDLLVFGIDIIIGTGIFVLTGIAAATKAGPSIVLSFVFSGITCAFAALCYAEFASTVPVAGSTYTFAYASMGEFVAWLIGWDLLLEVVVGASAISVSWAKYFNTILTYLGIHLPAVIIGEKSFVFGLSFNLLATFIAVLLTVIVTIGIRESARFNLVVTSIKISVVLFFIIFGIFFIKTANWHPFIPPPGPAPTPANSSGGNGLLDQPFLTLFLGKQPAFGFQGIISGAAVVFFAYIGFEIVSTTAEETRNPQRDMPIGILGSLAICTVLYIAVSFVLTGMVHYTRLNTEAPMATAFCCDLDSFCRLACDRYHHLLRVRRAPQPSRDGATGETGGCFYAKRRVRYSRTLKNQTTRRIGALLLRKVRRWATSSSQRGGLWVPFPLV